MVMVLIIVITFATFFFIINVNAQNIGLTYVPDFGLSSMLNSLLSTYFITIGDFSYESFSTGPNVTSCWIMFIFATFFNCVVFMNMLVAIMSQTFTEVVEAEEESGLHEQILLINDYVSLIDHQETWKHKRYIFSVQVLEQAEENDANVKDMLTAMEDGFNKKTERLHGQQQKKLNLIERILDNQSEQLLEIKQFMSTIISTVRESDIADDSFDDDSEVEGLQHND